MRPSKSIACKTSVCTGVSHDAFIVPSIDVAPEKIRMIMISECAPASSVDYFYSGSDSLFATTTIQAFVDAGEKVNDIKDLLELGVYLSTAVKCGKTQPTIEKGTIANCSHLLEKELNLFPNAKVLLLMGDAAIYAINCIAKRNGLSRPIPAGSTYKIRGGDFAYKGIKLFPSYLQAGPSFYIEKGKRKMITEDIAAGMRIMRSKRTSNK